MGLSLMFIKIDPENTGGDWAALKEFLAARNLYLSEPAESDRLMDILTADGQRLTFDGRLTDLHLGAPEEPLSGGVWHAHLSLEECDFIFGLCSATGLAIINCQGNPVFLVPNRNRTPEQLAYAKPGEGEAAWISSGAELQQALTGTFDKFIQWRDQILSQPPLRPDGQSYTR